MVNSPKYALDIKSSRWFSKNTNPSSNEYINFLFYWFDAKQQKLYIDLYL